MSVEVMDEASTDDRAGGGSRMLRWVVGAAGGLVCVWLALAFGVTPLEHGSVWGGLQCDPDPDREEVSDIFGGGGEIVSYVDGAVCNHFFSIRNPSFLPITLISAELTPEWWQGPLMWESAQRSRAVYYEELRSIGSEEDEIPLSPVRNAPGQEWGLRLHGRMANCTPPSGDSPTTMSQQSQRVHVRVLGVPRSIDITLASGYAVATETCGRE